MQDAVTKEQLIACFEDTQYLYETDPELVAYTAEAKRKTVIFYEKAVPKRLSNTQSTAEISIMQDTTFHAARLFTSPGKTVAVLNFASPLHPGGGVQNGAMAQEECLCRSSNLYACLSQPALQNEYYQYHRAQNDVLFSDRLIYSKGVTVFKSDEDLPKLLLREDWRQVDVITCAMPDLHGGVQFSTDVLLPLYKRRIRAVLHAAYTVGAQRIVLGAFGCGAFCNAPELVAEAFRAVLLEDNYAAAFDKVVFAIKPTEDTHNYTAFQKAFGTAKTQISEDVSKFYVWRNAAVGDFDLFAELTAKDMQMIVKRFGEAARSVSKMKTNGQERYYYFVNTYRKTLTPLPTLRLAFGGQYDETPYGVEIRDFELDLQAYTLLPYDRTQSPDAQNEAGDVPVRLANRFMLKAQLCERLGTVAWRAWDMQMQMDCFVRMVDHEQPYGEQMAQTTLADARNRQRMDAYSVPKVLYVGEEGSKVFTVSEWIDGENVLDLMRKNGSLPQARVVNIAIQLCDILYAMETLSPPFVHRGITPKNLMLKSSGQVYLLDFSAAKAYAYTQNGADCFGVFGYAAPEQLSADGYTDWRADIYSLGITMYVLLTGIEPNEKQNRYLPLRQYNPCFSERLEAVLLKCTQPNAGLRYQNAIELKEDLRKAARRL
ncbi:MAG: TIGR02452 family protein [Candidatus Fimenecus sp.]